jgi:predicted nucleotidyltransferase
LTLTIFAAIKLVIRKIDYLILINYNLTKQAENNSMRPSVVLEKNRMAVREAVKRFRTANPRVFGSVLHGRDHEGSDVDLLVDALPGATLFDLGGLQVELESLLGLRVDLLTPGDLPQKFRAKVLEEALPV